jgi:hypothetical protein
MSDCPTCEYHKQRAQIWRDEVYRLAGHPLPEREQEPVGWIDSKGNMICTKINESCKPLYTTPQQRTWVGLTEDEVFAISNTMPYGDRFEFAKAIEQALKERNT